MRTFILLLAGLLNFCFWNAQNLEIAKLNNGEWVILEEAALLDLFKYDISSQTKVHSPSYEIAPNKQEALISWKVQNDLNSIASISVWTDLEEEHKFMARGGDGPGVKAKIICKGINGCSFCYAKFIMQGIVPYPICECREETGDGDCEMTIEFEIDLTISLIKNNKKQ